MQTFAVEFHLSYKGKSLESIATIHFDAETFADLLMQLQQGESDSTTRQRLLDAIAFEEEDNPDEFQLTSLTPEGEVIADEEDDEDYSDDEEETTTLH